METIHTLNFNNQPAVADSNDTIAPAISYLSLTERGMYITCTVRHNIEPFVHCTPSIFGISNSAAVGTAFDGSLKS